MLTLPLFVFLGAPPPPPLSLSGIVAPTQSGSPAADGIGAISAAAASEAAAAAPRPDMALIPPLRGSENLERDERETLYRS